MHLLNFTSGITLAVLSDFSLNKVEDLITMFLFS